MKQVLPIFKREFLGYFRTPVAYVFLVVFHVLATILAFFASGFLRGGEASLEPFFVWLPWICCAFVPAAAMRLWSEEKRSGTIELLFTMPVSTTEAVVAKFLAAWAFITLAIVLTFPFALTAAYLGDPDWGAMLIGYLGGILMSAGYLGLSSVASSLTRNQVVAFVLALVANLFFTLLGWSLFNGFAESFLPVVVVEAISNFGFTTHFTAMTRGLVELRAIVFFLSMVLVTLPLTALVLKHGTLRALLIGLEVLAALVVFAFVFALGYWAVTASGWVNPGALATKGGQLVILIALVAWVALGLKVLNRAAAGGLLLAVALLQLGYIAAVFPARLDFTADRIYSLSDGTRQLLGKIEEPMTLQLYFTRSVEGLPIQFKNYASRVEEMLRQYVAAARGRITLKVVDPRPDTDEDSAARRAGLSPQALASGEQIIFGLVATQSDQEKVIEFFTPNREQFLEYDVSQLIHSVQQFDKPRLGLLTGLPLRGNPYAAMMGQRPQPDQLVISEWEKTFEVVSVEDSAETLPDNLDVLAVIHPQNVGDRLLFAIDQFLLSGKPVLVAVDPSSYLMKGQQRQQQMMMGGPQPGVSSNLPRLFASWGINYQADNVVGDLELAAQVNTGAGVASFPTWLRLGRDQFAADVMPTASINNMVMVEPGSIEVAADRGYEVTPLVQTSARAGSVPSMMLQFTQPNELARQIRTDTSEKHLAVLVRGSFKSAFPGGAPKVEKPAEEKTEDGTTTPAPAVEEPAAPSLQESAQPGTLIVIGDTDWLLDDFSVRRMNFLGMQAIEPINDNLAFGTNLLDFIGGSRDLISVRTKGSSQRPFEVIARMEREAQERYQASLEELEKKLSDVQAELTKLQTTQAEGKRLVATPEVQAAIERYRAQEADMRSERREIRRALREGIEGLQNRLTVLNFLSSPALVIAIGLGLMLPRFLRHTRVLRTDEGAIELHLWRHAAAVGALLVLAVAAWAVTRPPGATGDSRAGEPVLEQDVLGKVASVVLRSEGKEVTLVNTDPKNAAWVVREYYDLPVDFSKLSRFINELRDAKIERFVSANPERLERMEFGKSRIELRDAGGGTLWSADLGRTATGGSRMVKFGEEEKAYLANLNSWLDTTPKNWADARLITTKPDQIVGLEVGFAGETRPLRFTRDNGTAPWKADGLAEGETVKESAVSSLLSKVSELRFTETAEPTAPDVTAAKENARTIKVTLLDGRTYTVTLGRRPAPPAPPAPTPPPAEGAPAEGSTTPAATTPPAPQPGPVYAFVESSVESDPINDLMDRRAYQIGEWTFTDLPADRAALIEKAPPPPAGAPAPAATPPPTTP